MLTSRAHMRSLDVRRSCDPAAAPRTPYETVDAAAGTDPAGMRCVSDDEIAVA
jgi:hypothetical protein